MRNLALCLLLASIRCGFSQTDTNLLATGDWSTAISDHRGSTLRGRLLVYDEHTAPNHARIYLELQHVFKGVWDLPIDIYYDVGPGGNLVFEIRDEHDRPVPMEGIGTRGMLPRPHWVTIPSDSTIRLRADLYNMGEQKKPDGFVVLVGNGISRWVIRPTATNDFDLSATFTTNTNHPSPLTNNLWQGTLDLPKVKIPVPKP